MSQKDTKNIYDDGNIPEIDLPQDAGITHAQNDIHDDTGNQSGSSVHAPFTRDVLDIPVTPPVLLSTSSDSTQSHFDRA